MRVLVVMSAYNEEDFIKANIKSLYPYVDMIAVGTSNHITGAESDDNTREELQEAIVELNDGRHGKIVTRHSSDYSRPIPYDEREGMVKTELMNMMEPEDGDWIWVVDADEFYSAVHLELLRSRYLLNHKALQYDKHCLMVSAMCFAYNHNWFYFSRHGRFFRYKKGSYFNRVNHFTWADGTPVYGDKLGWDIPPAYMYMYHMRYVRRSLDRLRNRYVYRKDAAGQRKLQWFDEVFMQFPKDPKTAYANNDRLYDVRGFDGSLSGYLKYMLDPATPIEIIKMNIDLFEELKRR